MITFIDQISLTDKKILMRVDFNVSLGSYYKIADDERIRAALPTINYLLQEHNKLILVSHLGRPKGRDLTLSLRPVAEKLQEYLPEYEVVLIDDFQSKEGKDQLAKQTNKQICLLENIRFYAEEEKNDPAFSKALASLADIFVNEGFSVSHRQDASIVGIPQILPPYGGLELHKEIEMIEKVLTNPQKPVVAIIGGVKISTKINLLHKLITITDSLLLGGGLANTFLLAQGHPIGTSIVEKDEIEQAKTLLTLATEKKNQLLLPTDVLVGKRDDDKTKGVVKSLEEVGTTDDILDIGPQTQKEFSSVIAQAKTIIWNGPVGYSENVMYRVGTFAIFDAITHNTTATSLVGGGDTLAAIAHKEEKNHITFISTGGGAMLSFIENGTLPGITALNK